MPRRPPAVARVLERVTQTAREHDMFGDGPRVLVMVSGGPDSVCLLHALHLLRRLLGLELQVLHVDHRLREDSGRDARYVERMAAKLAVPFHLRVVEGRPKRGDSLEDWARRQRMTAARDVRDETEASSVAFGHTLDDQAETVLLALLRGGGLESLAGIRPAVHPLIHPLIDVRRSQTHAFCRALGLRPRQDPSNRDTRLMRNALRLKGIPALERAVGRDVVEPISRSAKLLHMDRMFITSAVGTAMTEEDVIDLREGLLRAEALASLDRSLASRVVRALLRARLDALPEQHHIDAVLDLARGRPGRKIDLPGGFTAMREREYIRISSPED